MKLSPDSTPALLHLLLLAELFVHSSSRPPHTPSLCGVFRSIHFQMEKLMNLSKKLHDLSDDELSNFASAENKLHDLPHIPHTAANVSSLKVNESLSQLYVYIQSFKLHADWLKTAKENFSLPSQPAEDVSSHLLQLSKLLNASLHQIIQEVPQTPPPSFPVVSMAFDVLQFSVEMADQLQVFGDWLRRVLRHLQKLSRCSRH